MAVVTAASSGMTDGQADVVAGFRNKVQAAMAKVTPSAVLAGQHLHQAHPGTAPGQGGEPANWLP